MASRIAGLTAVLFLATWAADVVVESPHRDAPPAGESMSVADAIAIPRLLSYQGKLTDTAGRAVPDSEYSVSFRLYTVTSGGSPFWNEAQNVRTRGGLFSVLLGARTQIGAVPDAGALYLGMTVSGGAEFSPRVRIVSAAYAYKADTAGYALAGAGGGDNAWVRGGDSALYTVHQLGIARGGADNVLYGNERQTHVNLGVACTTGTSGQNYGYATVAGGNTNRAADENATVGGGTGNCALGLSSVVGGGYGNSAPGAYATVGGGIGNQADFENATVAGGFSNVATLGATVGGGYNNDALGEHATVGGGSTNDAVGDYATVGGGYLNCAEGGATVGGGFRNYANGGATVGGGSDNDAAGICATIGGGDHNYAQGDCATVGGGFGNTANGSRATVPGGLGNAARGSGSFAAGIYACANHHGSFVWSDSAVTSRESAYTTNSNQFRVRARGGTWFFSNAGMTTGAYLAPGSNSWASACDSATKEDFREVDRKELLEKVAALRVRNYKIKDQDDGTLHIGPVAQDFAAAFGVGENNKSINMADADGVALAAIQALYDEMKARDEAQQKRIVQLETELARLKK